MFPASSVLDMFFAKNTGPVGRGKGTLVQAEERIKAMLALNVRYRLGHGGRRQRRMRRQITAFCAALFWVLEEDPLDLEISELLEGLEDALQGTI